MLSRARKLLVRCMLLVALCGTTRLRRERASSSNSSRLQHSVKGPTPPTPTGSMKEKMNLLEGELNFAPRAPRGPPSKFGGAAAALEQNLFSGRPRGPRPPMGDLAAELGKKFGARGGAPPQVVEPGSGGDNCKEEVICKSCLKSLSEKDHCPTRKEKLLIGTIRRAMLGESGTIPEAVTDIKEQLTRLIPMSNPDPLTMEQAEEFVKHPEGRLWQLVESEKGTAEMWCTGDGKINVEMPKEVKPPDPDPVEDKEPIVIETKTPLHRATTILEATKLFRQQAKLEKQDGISREAGARVLVKMVEATPVPVNQQSKAPNMAKKADDGPKPYGLPALNENGKLDQNLALVLRRLDFALKQSSVDYNKLFDDLFKGLPAIVGTIGDKESARIADLIFTAMNQVGSDDVDDLLKAVAEDKILKITSQKELANEWPAGLKPTSAFLRAWERHRTRTANGTITKDPKIVAKCALSRFSVPEVMEKFRAFVRRHNQYYSNFKRFSEHMSDTISQFIAAFFSAESDFYRAEDKMKKLAAKDYSEIEGRLLKYATIKGLAKEDRKFALANQAHALAEAALPLLTIANILNKNDFNLRATSGQAAQWKPSLLDTFLYFIARTSNEHHEKKSAVFIHSMKGNGQPNGERGKLIRPGQLPDSWDVDVPKKGTIKNVPEANLAVGKTLLDHTTNFCSRLVSSAPVWDDSLGNIREELMSLAKELMACIDLNVKLPVGEEMDNYIGNVDAARNQLMDAERLLTNALGPAYLSLLPEYAYDGSSVIMPTLRDELTLWQKLVISNDDKTMPHPQPFVSLFDDYTLRTNIHNFCKKANFGASLALSEHFHSA